MRALLFLLTSFLCVASVHGWAGVAVKDARGRVFANAGTEPDKVLVDGHVFASGFHSIQALAWHGRDLWISNSPDLTVVRDTNDDGEADDYVLIARHLGDAQHGLHGIAWGADGKLYLATSNLALMPARELGRPMKFHKGEYAPFPFTPPAETVGEGGVLRCDADGRSLEIVKRGFSNPTSVWFDDAFRLGQGTEPEETAGAGAKEKRDQPYDQWAFEELAEDLGAANAAQSIAAQEELMRRGESIKVGMIQWLERQDLTQRQRTWALWTLGRAGKDDVEIEAYFPAQLSRSKDVNTRQQCVRIVAFRMKEFGFTKQVPQAVKAALKDENTDVRKGAEALIHSTPQ